MFPVSVVFLCAHILITADGSSLELGYSLSRSLLNSHIVKGNNYVVLTCNELK